MILQKRAFTLNGRRKIDDIIVVHKSRSAQVLLNCVDAEDVL